MESIFNVAEAGLKTADSAIALASIRYGEGKSGREMKKDVVSFIKLNSKLIKSGYIFEDFTKQFPQYAVNGEVDYLAMTMYQDMKKKLDEMDNRVSILSKASDLVSEEECSEDNISKDWYNNFDDLIRKVSDDQMQDVWARVLAGEMKSPNSFSLRTLSYLKDMPKTEAELLNKIAGFVFEREAIYRFSNNKFNLDKYININDLLVLNDAGIINLSDITTTFEIVDLNKVEIGDNIMLIIRSSYANPLEINCRNYKFTKLGVELIRLIDVKTCDVNFAFAVGSDIKERYPKLEIEIHVKNPISGKFRFLSRTK